MKNKKSLYVIIPIVAFALVLAVVLGIVFSDVGFNNSMGSIFNVKTNNANSIYYHSPVYVGNDATKGIEEWEVKSADNYQTISKNISTVTVLTSGCYILDGKISIKGLRISGDVKLILTDNANVTVNNTRTRSYGIELTKKSSLSVYAYSNKGTLTVYGASGFSAIGGSSSANTSITINGGTINAIAGSNASAIGGIDVTWPIVINGGNVNAKGGVGGAGIGSSGCGLFETIVVNGGNVNAAGGDDASGIGGSGSDSLLAKNSQIYFNGGTVKSTGGSGCYPVGYGLVASAHIYISEDVESTIETNSGKTTINGKNKRDITSYIVKSSVFTTVYSNPQYKTETGASSILINYNEVEPTTKELTEGTWYVRKSMSTYNLKVTGKVRLVVADDIIMKVNILEETCKAGINVSGYSDSLSILGGENGSGKIIVVGGDYSAAIGGDFQENGQNINIYSCNIECYGGKYAPGIGGGFSIDLTNKTSGNSGDATNIKILGGKVKAVGGEYAAGIGTGESGIMTVQNTLYRATAERITITNAEVYAIGGNGAASIGSGVECNAESIEIRDSVLTLQNSFDDFDDNVFDAPTLIGHGSNGESNLIDFSSKISLYRIVDGTFVKIDTSDDFVDKLKHVHYATSDINIISTLPTNYEFRVEGLGLSADVTLNNFVPSDLFTTSKETYNNKLAMFNLLSSLAATNVGKVKCSLQTDWVDTKDYFLKMFGFSTPVVFDVESTDGLDTNDTTQITISYLTMLVDGKLKTYVNVSVANTVSQTEWFSNFDLGDTSDLYTNLTGEHPDWTDKLNHKGLDVTATRAINILNQYISSLGIYESSEEVIFGFNGYSRGAGVANIMASRYKYSDSNKESLYAYNFAVPNTTLKTDSGNVKCVFNIVNKEDLITNIPPAGMGYRRYGQDVQFTLVNNNTLQSIYAGFGNGSFNEGKNSELATAMNAVCKNNLDYYTIDYTDYTKITGSKTYSSNEAALQAIEDEKLKITYYFGDNALKYVDFKVVQNGNSYCYDTYFAPAFIGNVLAVLMRSLESFNLANITVCTPYFQCERFKNILKVMSGANYIEMMTNANAIKNNHIPVPYMSYIVSLG